jgi:hypothetical protein
VGSIDEKACQLVITRSRFEGKEGPPKSRKGKAAEAIAIVDWKRAGEGLNLGKRSNCCVKLMAQMLAQRSGVNPSVETIRAGHTCRSMDFHT